MTRRTHQQLLLLVTVTALSAGPLNAQMASTGAASNLEKSVSSTITPGDDFFAYANGAWLASTKMPPGKERWTGRDEINIVTRDRIARLVDAAATAPTGSSARKVADYRAAYLNDNAINQKALTPIQGELDSITAIPDKAALVRYLGRTMPADVDPLNIGIYQSSRLLGFAVQRSNHGEKTNQVFLVQGGLGLGLREQYIGTDAKLAALRADYQRYVARALAFAGGTQADERAAAVVALETAIAETQASSLASANDQNADNRWTRADFASKAPGIEWQDFLDAAGLSQPDVIVVWQPGAVTGLAALIASRPVAVWQDYLRFHAVDEVSDLLPSAFAEQAASMHAAINGTQPAPRAQRAFEATQAAMGDAIGRMYVDKYLPPAQKRRIERIIANIADAFAKRIEAVTWMSPASKAIALKKVKSLYIGIGQPEKWQDYSDLVIDSADPIGNMRRVDARNRKLALARVGVPTDLREWWIAPQSVGAVLIFQQNTYQFSAGLLQAPKFDPTASDAATYGAIGTIIGHDISHFVDLLGAEYDTSFAFHHWWTASDLAGFKAKTSKLVEQFNGYRPFPDLGVNGKLTESENVADLAGLDAAFDAYRKSLGAKATDKRYVRTMDREFFIAFAQSYRSILSENAMRNQLATNDHAPEMFRMSTVRNLDAWYDAFDVKPGQKLYVAPADRVHVW